MALLSEFPPVSTAHGYFYAWRDCGLLATINQLLVMAAREIAGKQARPEAGVIDSQSFKTTESGGICGYDPAKNVKGRKRHIITDTLGLWICVGSTGLMFRIATAIPTCSWRSTSAIHGCAMSSLMAAMPATN